MRRGGYLSGHDFCPSTGGVVKAVSEFALLHNATIKTQADCWWFLKSEDGIWT